MITPPKPISLEQAQERLLSPVVPTDKVEIPLAEASGRYLAQDLSANRTQPAADLSAMDGYAVCLDDLSGPWKIVGESAAGHPYQGQLEAGEAIRISTGALLPAGSNAVLLQENANRNGDDLSLNGEGDPTPRHIRRKGFDFSAGDLLLTSGELLNPAMMALGISGGHSTCQVRRQPKVAILDSGDELSSDPAKLANHQIPASNGDMLQAMIAPITSDLVRLGPVKDRLPDMISALKKAADCDVIVTSGGASVGDHDLVKPALEDWGAKIDFWRIAMKPGKPLMVARKGNKTIVGLPGNPVSSYVTAFLFLLPLLRAISGSIRPLPKTIPLPLCGNLPAVGRRLEFVRAQLVDGSAAPVDEQDSSALGALSQADLLIRREIGSEAAQSGDLVHAYLLQNGGIA